MHNNQQTLRSCKREQKQPKMPIHLFKIWRQRKITTNTTGAHKAERTHYSSELSLPPLCALKVHNLCTYVAPQVVVIGETVNVCNYRAQSDAILTWGAGQSVGTKRIIGTTLCKQSLRQHIMYRFVGSQHFFFVTEWVVCLAPAKHACLYVHAYERTGVQPHVYSWVSVFFFFHTQKSIWMWRSDGRDARVILRIVKCYTGF